MYIAGLFIAFAFIRAGHFRLLDPPATQMPSSSIVHDQEKGLDDQYCDQQ
jgi:hypothetical protein